MNDDLTHAFAHPSMRANALRVKDGGPTLDRISLRDHIVEVEIGAFQAERGTTQRVSFNVVVEVAPLDVSIDDDVDRILSYDRVTEAIATALASERLNLLETLAERVAELILGEPQAMRVFIRIEKLDRGPGALGVEIVRGRGDLATTTPTGEGTPQPRVVHLSNNAIRSTGLIGAIDTLSADGAPLVLSVGVGDATAPDARHKMAQRRIDLLAVEQNAWCLAARDDRFIVVDTRTELDWGMRNGQISVWAPSKMILDAVDGPAGVTADPVAMTLWMADELGAREIVLVGSEAQVSSYIPLRHIKL